MPKHQNPDDIIRMFLNHDNDNNPPYSLREALALLNTKHEFKPGDFVQWKHGMRNCIKPDDGAPIIVVGIHPGRIDTKADANHAHEPNDLECMFWYGNEWTIYHFDARRFEPYIKPESSEIN